MAHILKTIALAQIGGIRGLVQERKSLAKVGRKGCQVVGTQRSRLEEEQGRSLRQGQFSCGKGGHRCGRVNRKPQKAALVPLFWF